MRAGQHNCTLRSTSQLPFPRKTFDCHRCEGDDGFVARLICLGRVKRNHSFSAATAATSSLQAPPPVPFVLSRSRTLVDKRPISISVNGATLSFVLSTIVAHALSVSSQPWPGIEAEKALTAQIITITDTAVTDRAAMDITDMTKSAVP